MSKSFEKKQRRKKRLSKRKIDFVKRQEINNALQVLTAEKAGFINLKGSARENLLKKSISFEQFCKMQYSMSDKSTKYDDYVDFYKDFLKESYESTIKEASKYRANNKNILSKESLD